MTLRILCLVLACSQGWAAANDRIYVSVAGEKRIASYRIDDDSGKLSLEESTSLPGEPGALTVDPSRRLLLAALRSSGELCSLRIDPDTGGLTLLSVVPTGPDPAFIATDRTGRYLFAAHYIAGDVTVHRIEPDGTLPQEPLQRIATDNNAHAILTDRANRWAYVAHTGPNAIDVFKFDPSTGQLQQANPAVISTGPSTGPRHLAFHHKQDVVYFDFEQGSAVAAFRINPETGALTNLQTLPTIPSDFDGSNSCARLQMHPSGKFLFAANRGHDSLAGFFIDPESGALTALGQTPTEATPRGFDITSDGEFVVVAGESSGGLATCRVDQGTGSLTEVARIECGERPWWVLCVPEEK